MVFKGGFWIFNRTPKIPLRFALTSSSHDLVLDRCEGSFSAASSSSAGSDGIWIGLTLSCQKFGFYNHYIMCENLNNSGQKSSIIVNAFIDEKNLFVPQTNFKWENIYVAHRGDLAKPTLAIQKKKKDENTTTYETPIEVQNCLEKTISIQILSDILLSIRWVELNGVPLIFESPNSLEMDSQYKAFNYIGQGIVLNPKQKMVAMLSLPPLLTIDDEDMINLVQNGKKILQSGTLLIQNLDTKIHMKALEVNTSFCQSKGSIMETEIDLGKIGQTNRWKEVPIIINLVNNSEIPLCYDVDLPDFISMTGIGPKFENLKAKISSLGSHSINFSLNPKIVDAGASGPMCCKISIVNLYNPSNIIEAIIKFQMTQFELKFDRLRSGELILPALTHPSPPNALPCDTWFTVTNISDRDVKFDVGYTLAPDVGGLISMEVLSRISNSPITSVVNLASKATLDLKIRIAAVEKSKLNISSSSYLTNSEGITLGTFWVSTKSKSEAGAIDANSARFAESFPIRGVLVEGKTFALSEKQLLFKSVILSDSDDEDKSIQSIKSPVVVEQMQHLVLTNLSAVFPLEVLISVEYPIEFSSEESMFDITPLNEDGIAYVNPSSTLVLQLALHKRYVYGISDDIKVLFTDKNSLSKKPQILVIKFAEDSITRTSELKVETAGVPLFGNMNHSPVSENCVDEKKLLSSSIENYAPTLTPSSHQDLVGVSKHFFDLKGCKKSFGLKNFEIDGLYELDVGQQDLSTNPLTKRLTLESSQKMEYRVFSLSLNDSSWLTVSQSDAHSDSARSSVVSNSNTSIISLNFSLLVRGCYSTYLVVENLENPLDTKFIRVTIEIVGKQNVKRSYTTQNSVVLDPLKPSELTRVFDVTTHALDLPETELNIGPISFGTFYVSRSFIIWNRESAPLEFSVSTNISRDEESELIISLSRTGAKLFNTVRIEAESYCQIFLRFIIIPQKGAKTDRSYTESKEIEIYVNCRLVKDYQKVIFFKALCFVPQLFVDCTDFVFSGAFRFEEKVTMKTTNDYFTLNNQSATPLEYYIASDSLYFGLEVCSSSPSILETRSVSSSLHSTENNENLITSKIWLVSALGSRSFTIPPNSSQKIRIIPLIENIEKHSEQLKKVKIFLIGSKNTSKTILLCTTRTDCMRRNEFTFAYLLDI